MIEAYSNHTYLIDLYSRQSVESEGRLKLPISANCEWGRAPTLPEPTRHPARPGYPRKAARKEDKSEENFTDLLQKFRSEIRNQDNGVGEMEEKLPYDIEFPTLPSRSEIKVKPRTGDDNSEPVQKMITPNRQ